MRTSLSSQPSNSIPPGKIFLTGVSCIAAIEAGALAGRVAEKSLEKRGYSTILSSLAGRSIQLLTAGAACACALKILCK